MISGRSRPIEAALARFRAAIDRRVAREPFAYIVGRREFFSLDFAVGPGVLIPRPESEMLVEEALRRFPARDETLRVLDLGTGSGCLLLAFLAERPKRKVSASTGPRSRSHFARRNAEQLGLGATSAISCAAIGAKSLASKFDLIFVNPPYVRTGDIVTLAPEVASHEPASALDGGTDGLACYRHIAPQLPELLSARRSRIRGDRRGPSRSCVSDL